jgi:hypothetical protein
MTPTSQFDHLIGKTRDEAVQLEPAYTIRVVKVDGEPTVVTRDIQLFRINVEVEYGFICKVVGLG